MTETLTEHKSNILGDKIEKIWKAEEVRAAKKKKVPSLQRALFKLFGWEFLLYGIVLAASETIR